MKWFAYDNCHPRTNERYTDFIVLYPNPHYSGREGCLRYIPDVQTWDGEKFQYFKPAHRPVFWCRLPKFPNQTTEAPSSKNCSACGRNLPLSSFNRDRSAKDGLTYDCRECRKIAARKYRQNLKWEEKNA